jgi:hypothetical protein
VLFSKRVIVDACSFGEIGLVSSDFRQRFWDSHRASEP